MTHKEAPFFLIIKARSDFILSDAFSTFPRTKQKGNDVIQTSHDP